MRRERLSELALRARADLDLLSYPAGQWVCPERTPGGEHVHAVLIVGGGQSGLAISAALRREGVKDVAVVDRSPAGREGVWDTFARMRELRTPKGLNGLDFGCPSLSVQRWYATAYGEDAWQALDRIPRKDWMDYLRWYRETLGLAIENDTEVLDIRPEQGAIGVVTRSASGTVIRLARTVVVATGYDGAGRWTVPAFISDALPPDRYDHTNGPVDFGRLRGRRVAVLGHGASAFDNANAALAAGAHVDLYFRRARLPRVNPHRFLETAGTMTHFCELPDAVRWAAVCYMQAADQPPPTPTFSAAIAHPRFRLHPGEPWTSARMEGGEVVVTTPIGEARADHLLLGTGATVEIEARPEYTTLAGVVLRWSDRFEPDACDQNESLGTLPYLDANYAFLARDAAQDWVSRVFCFNFASVLSHGPHSTSISGHRHCVPRVVRGVTGRLFADQAASFLDGMKAFDVVDLPIPDDFEARCEPVDGLRTNEEQSHERRRTQV
jgi:cation diffusion facilitator CzcD-associated flavoprotein CzcO